MHPPGHAAWHATDSVEQQQPTMADADWIPSPPTVNAAAEAKMPFAAFSRKRCRDTVLESCSNFCLIELSMLPSMMEPPVRTALVTLTPRLSRQLPCRWKVKPGRTASNPPVHAPFLDPRLLS